MHVDVNAISKTFSDSGAVPLFEKLSLSINKGESFGILGPNGCGKTTLLHIISGIEPFGKGDVVIGGKPIDRARIGFVFQDYNASLFPWKTVRENIEYALDCHHLDKSLANKWLKQLHLEEHTAKYPYQLSGGQRQRLAIARALSIEPELLILDEPFSALDFSTKLKLEEELRLLAQETNTTMLFVSHDLEQAIFLADRVGILGGNPTTFQSIIPINLPTKRSASTRLTSIFLDCKKGVFSAYESQA